MKISRLIIKNYRNLKNERYAWNYRRKQLRNFRGERSQAI